MNKYEKIYLEAEKLGRSSWVKTSVAALAVDLEEATGKPVSISGPFGLRAAVYITIGKDAENDRTFMCVTPDFSNGSFRLFYDTEKSVKRYAPDTIGGLNGFNIITAPMPDTLEEIIALFRRCR